MDRPNSRLQHPSSSEARVSWTSLQISLYEERANFSVVGYCIRSGPASVNAEVSGARNYHERHQSRACLIGL